MAHQRPTDREQVEAFVEWIKDPLPTIIPNWEWLSPRQKEVMKMFVCQRMYVKEIAAELHISVQTAKNHTQKASKKTDITLSMARDLLHSEIYRRANELV